MNFGIPPIISDITFIFHLKFNISESQNRFKKLDHWSGFGFTNGENKSGAFPFL